MRSRRIFLHVGLPKSGTTYLQTLLTANRQCLRERAGLLFPGAEWEAQVRAVRDVRQMRGSARRRRAVHGAWNRLVEEMTAWGGNSIVSMEWLCAAKPQHILRIVEDLAPAEVEVVFTVRDLGRTLPAAWQEFVQNREEWSWPEFLAGVTAPEPYGNAPGRRFWSQQDIARLIGRWTEAVPVGRTHVLTVPPPGVAPVVLWQRMSRVLGVDGSDCAVQQPTSNVSLGLESAELLRRLNAHARYAGIDWSRYEHVFKRDLAKGFLARRKDWESRLGIPEAYHARVREMSARQVLAIEGSGVGVVGDLAELQPALNADGATQPEDVSDEVLLQTALAALVTMAERIDITGRRSRSGDRRGGPAGDLRPGGDKAVVLFASTGPVRQPGRQIRRWVPLARRTASFSTAPGSR